MYRASKRKFPKSPSNILSAATGHTLSDRQLTEMTNREVEFWSRRLHLSPSQLFTLSDDDLDQRLTTVYQDTVDYYLRSEEAVRQQRVQRFKKLANFKQRMQAHQRMIRLRGGGQTLPATKPKKRTPLEILFDAALEIEATYGKNIFTATNTPSHAAYDYNYASATPANLSSYNTASVYPNVTNNSRGGGDGKTFRDSSNGPINRHAPVHYRNTSASIGKAS